MFPPEFAIFNICPKLHHFINQNVEMKMQNSGNSNKEQIILKIPDKINKFELLQPCIFFKWINRSYSCSFLHYNLLQIKEEIESDSNYWNVYLINMLYEVTCNAFQRDENDGLRTKVKLFTLHKSRVGFIHFLLDKIFLILSFFLFWVFTELMGKLLAPH